MQHIFVCLYRLPLETSTPVLALELSAAAKLSPSSNLHHAQCLTTMMRTLRGAKTFENTFCAIDDDFHPCGVAKPAVSMYMHVYTHISKMMITCNWIQSLPKVAHSSLASLCDLLYLKLQLPARLHTGFSFCTCLFIQDLRHKAFA